ncbi:hypothetical protein PIB30_117999 [Stylosanthes scabra]|uniref:Uncharacterized protein n=1 Tax=Stylosanthes scabra TaxID=79078 RepID=A0ABU6R6Y0_9FABA|nr:hypothetical protein [Stylosanthes scabra]
MAKNGVTLAISIMLTILVMICSSIDTFHETISKQVWTSTTSYYIIVGRTSYSLDRCVNQCMRRYKNNNKSKKECILECIKRKCRQLYPNDEKKQLECIEYTVAIYNKKILRNPIDVGKTPKESRKPRNQIQSSKSRRKNIKKK